MSEFEGKVAVITGGASGIGLASARMFVERGAKVVIADMADGAAAVAELKALGGEAVYVKANVTAEADVQNMVRTAVASFGRLDYGVNSAGIGGAAAPVADLSLDDWNKVISINLTGVFLSMKHQIPEMLKTGGGAVVNISSILGWVGWATSSAYVASKHGVIGLTKAAALEYATQNVRVNAVSPGFIYTPLLETAGIVEGNELSTYIANLHAMKRMGRAEEVAAVVIWLCSDGASFVTGMAHLVDGGFVAQ
ncbi:MAG: SDR family oxidoreductase [Anaerolineae bacterium]|nr:SDR family oxidoreductase [Anaerolineae bacterium]